MPKYGMVIDLDRCIACQACTIACKFENNLREGEDWHTLITVHNGGNYPSPVVEMIPRPCYHCEKAPCVKVCPTGASYKAADGRVLINYEKCIGCKYCMVACPYGARVTTDRKPTAGVPSYEEAFGAIPKFGNPDLSVESNKKGLLLINAWNPKPKGLVSKCNFCAHRAEQAKKEGKKFGNPDGIITTACNEACPTEARYFGDLSDPNSYVSRLLASRPHTRVKENLGTGPQVYYLK